jgi:FkbM family methyltransferase
MSISTERGNALFKAYSLVKRSGFLDTSHGRRLFKTAYFFYKRFLEDDLHDLVKAFPELIGDGNVLDIGANIGYTATVLARAVKPGSKVFAFEPEPYNFGILQQTARQARFDGTIVPMRCAVGAANGTIELWINLAHHADHRVFTEQFHSQHPGSTGIDSFLESHQGKISFVKIDVQGYELAVCRGMEKTIEQNPEVAVLLEYMPSAMRELGFDSTELIDFFVQRGFEIYRVHPRGKLTRGLPAAIGDSTYFDLLFSRKAMDCDPNTP